MNDHITKESKLWFQGKGKNLTTRVNELSTRNWTSEKQILDLFPYARDRKGTCDHETRAKIPMVGSRYNLWKIPRKFVSRHVFYEIVGCWVHVLVRLWRESKLEKVRKSINWKERKRTKLDPSYEEFHPYGIIIYAWGWLEQARATLQHLWLGQTGH